MQPLQKNLCVAKSESILSHVAGREEGFSVFRITSEET